jgi:hypothetical protein
LSTGGVDNSAIVAETLWRPCGKLPKKCESKLLQTGKPWPDVRMGNGVRHGFFKGPGVGA